MIEDNADRKQILEAVKEIVDTVKDLVQDKKLKNLTKEAIRYTEELISKALDKEVKVQYRGKNVPKVKEVHGALIGIEADKEVTLSLEIVDENQVPAINEKYENMCAMDIKLWAAEEAVQPLVPVTIRMQLPESIDKEKSIKVLHFADGESEPEELESTVLDDEIEITAPGFSIFAIVNVADEIQDNQDVNQNDGLADNQEKDNSNSASSSNQISVEKSGNKTIIIVVLVVLLILSLAAGIVAAVVKFKKNNE